MAFTVVNKFSKFNKKFQLRQHTVEFKLKEIEQPLDSVEQWIKDGLEDIYNLVSEALTPDDKVGLTLSSELLQYEVHVPTTEASNMSFDRLWELMHELYQSNTEATEGDTLKLTMTSFPARKPTVNKQGNGLENLVIDNESSNQPSAHPSTVSSSSSIVEMENQTATTSSTTGYQASGRQDEKKPECRVCRCRLGGGVWEGDRVGSELCERCYIKAGQCKQQFIPYSSQSWNKYGEFKAWQTAYDKKKVRCTICDREMGRTAIYRHMKRKHSDAKS